MNELNKTEAAILLAVITGDESGLPADWGGNRVDKAKNNLIERGYLRLNEHRIIELNLSSDYYKQRGY